MYNRLTSVSLLTRTRRRTAPMLSVWVAAVLAMPALARVAAAQPAAARNAAAVSAAADTTAAELLDELVRLALERNLALAQERLTERQADASLREARGALLPSLAFDARYSEFSGVVNIGDFINPAYAALNQLLGQEAFPTNIAATLPFRQETRLRLQQPLYNHAAISQWRLMRTLRGVDRAQREIAERQLAADVQLAWLGLAGATRVVDVFDATLELLAENERVADRLLSAGQGTVDAVYRARADRSEVAQQRADAVQRRDAARRLLNLLVDRDPDTPITIADDSTLVRTLPVDHDNTVRAALAGREELEQARLGVQAAAEQQRLASSGFYPILAVAADRGIQGNDYRLDGSGNVAIASIVLQWNLFNGGQDNARRERATFARRKTELREREATRQVVLQVEQAWDAARVAEQALRTAADRLEAAQRSFTLVSRRYEEGLAPHVEFVAARAAATEAELNAVLTRFTYAARRVELERAGALRSLTP